MVISADTSESSAWQTGQIDAGYGEKVGLEYFVVQLFLLRMGFRVPEQALSAAARQAGFRRDLSAAEAMVEAMGGISFVGPAFTHEELQKGVSRDPFAVLFQHSYTPGRAGGLLSTYGIEMWLEENVLSWGMPVGATHGSPHLYDRWAPPILMGSGIEGGTVDSLVQPLDLAPTLAGLAGVPFPDDLDGRPLVPGKD